MVAYPLRTAALTLGAAIGLSACTTGLGYGPYGGSGVSVGINSGYYDPYYDGYGYGYGYSRAGYGYTPYWGWYDGFYYPGTGYYVYDRYRRPRHWTEAERRYWNEKRTRTLAEGFRRVATDNWEDFSQPTSSSTRRVRTSADSPVVIQRRGDRPSRIERSDARSERRAVRLERQSTRSDRSTVRSERRSESRSDRSSRSSGRSDENRRER